MKNKIFSLLLSLIFIFPIFTTISCKDTASNDIIILYENDVHCEVEGYSKISAMKKELIQENKYVGVVSSGDFLQGGTLGSVSKGGYIIDLMNLVGYDAIALGNHDFDFRLPRLEELNAISTSKFLSCNFQKIGENNSYFNPYKIVTYGNKKIAYIGITTPDTIRNSSPTQFRDSNGNFIYTFKFNSLYQIVQNNINLARQNGADYVIAVSHIGYQETVIDIVDIIQNTYGLDVVLDGHSHTVLENEIVKNQVGKNVVLSSTGTKFEYIGKLTIKGDSFTTELIPTESYQKTDSVIDARILEINESYQQLGNRKIGETTVKLITHDEQGNRLIRNAETNLGNFSSDALRIVSGADISYVNGGGVRESIDIGDITYNELLSVFPFNDQVATVLVTGQILLDMLEMSIVDYPAEDGTFPHVSGIKFCVNTAISSNVVKDADGCFVSVNGDYRVYNVTILDKESGKYLPLDKTKEYVLAGFDYILVELGSGMSMMKNATILNGEGSLEVDVLERYIIEHLGGVVGNKYVSVDNRITFTNGFV